MFSTTLFLAVASFLCGFESNAVKRECLFLYFWKYIVFSKIHSADVH